MKKIFTLLAFMCSITAGAQNVGIGISNPEEKLQVDSGNIKIGKTVLPYGASNLLRFGDGDYAHVGEVGDDSMEIKTRNLSIISSYGGITNVDLNGSLHMTGSLTIKDGSEGLGKVLVSDYTGNASWGYPANYKTGFQVGKSSSQIIGSGSGSSLVYFDYENYDDANAYADNAFTAPTGGVYHFDVKIFLNLTAVASRYTISLEAWSGGLFPTPITMSQRFIEAGSSGSTSIDLSFEGKLNAGERFAVYFGQNSGISQTIISQYGSVSGHRVY